MSEGSHPVGGIHPPTLEKRLLRMHNTPDSINGMATWCLQKRPYAAEVIQVWLNTFKKATSINKLTLFYLANDVIQTSTHKHITDFHDMWKEALLQAVPYVRGETETKKKIERVFKIWMERRIYSKHFVERLLSSLQKPAPTVPPAASVMKKPPVAPTSSKEKGMEKEMAARVANFQPSEFADQLRRVDHAEKTVSRAEAQLETLSALNDPQYNVSPEEFRSKFKDRASTEKTLRELDKIVEVMKTVIEIMKEDFTAREDLLNTTETAVHHYKVQEKEAKTVAAAYESYLEKVGKQRTKVNELCLTLPSPPPSPHVDAPSPSPDDDMDLDLDSIQTVAAPAQPMGLSFMHGAAVGQMLGNLDFSKFASQVEDIPLPTTSISMPNGGAQQPRTPVMLAPPPPPPLTTIPQVVPPPPPPLGNLQQWGRAPNTWQQASSTKPHLPPPPLPPAIPQIKSIVNEWNDWENPSQWEPERSDEKESEQWESEDGQSSNSNHLISLTDGASTARNLPQADIQAHEKPTSDVGYQNFDSYERGSIMYNPALPSGSDVSLEQAINPPPPPPPPPVRRSPLEWENRKQAVQKQNASEEKPVLEAPVPVPPPPPPPHTDEEQYKQTQPDRAFYSSHSPPGPQQDCNASNPSPPSLRFPFPGDPRAVHPPSHSISSWGVNRPSQPNRGFQGSPPRGPRGPNSFRFLEPRDVSPRARGPRFDPRGGRGSGQWMSRSPMFQGQDGRPFRGPRRGLMAGPRVAPPRGGNFRFAGLRSGDNAW
ncbi:unnamed protein product [Cyprideis torosa]|uniref:Uncharacterized protein n=1 Tax=Cyprideis torosa TaxID=163714 RepID=A0A7R8ZKL5_9CRUS|nr:unnamed protein product [Cyprideis torosa]CAG0889648.1 unnamed protein product [Cyprideis torosa]